jgi:hypothetical protein
MQLAPALLVLDDHYAVNFLDVKAVVLVLLLVDMPPLEYDPFHRTEAGTPSTIKGVIVTRQRTERNLISSGIYCSVPILLLI